MAADPSTPDPARSADGISVLFARSGIESGAAEPACFADLNLTAVVDAVVGEGDEHRLRPLFHQPVDAPTVALRHEVFRDLDESEELRGAVDRFHAAMTRVREFRGLAAKVDNRLERMGWHLRACRSYTEAVDEFATAMVGAAPRSTWLRALTDYLEKLVAGEAFVGLRLSQNRVTAVLGTIRYCVFLKKDTVSVRHYAGEPTYSADTATVMAAFTSGSPPARFAYGARPELNHVESQILDRVGQIFPDEFEQLGRFVTATAAFVDAGLERVDRELHFYTGYRAFTASIATTGLCFCLPTIVTDAEIPTWADGAFDLALALARVDDKAGGPVVCNGFRLDAPERAIVVSGPNQGGKTTFARMFGQLHHLASLGVPVPGTGAQLIDADHVYTHFEREEDATSDHGKLADELIRIHDVLERVTPRSVVVMNESFTSTSLHDARQLGRAILSRLIDDGILCLYVTFVEELSRLSPVTVSMVGSVDPADPARRTFRVTRRPADGRAYARAIAEKYSLTYDDVKRRVRS
ncbi:DNA mismatch repair protein MutS [Gordonia sp. X0973]|uniref:MutS-related protein n=1 Tax=Gordonia sp. X0973 TaxID=2742602 RepID=UPI000F53B052|nr:DNA mismatch repair protein MutS [Gordonia sp. X0973]QKT07036.1 DNA mismatch repair protein MutS [Gordonia sp. X0973]